MIRCQGVFKGNIGGAIEDVCEFLLRRERVIKRIEPALETEEYTAFAVCFQKNFSLIGCYAKNALELARG